MKHQLTLLLLCAAFSLSAGIIVTNGLTHEHSVVGGQLETGVVDIRNLSRTPQRVIFYISELSVSCKGETFQPSDTGNVKRSNAAWVSLSANERLLAPGEEFSLSYEIKTPEGERRGSFWSLLMVEEQPLIDTSSSRVGMRISSNVRYAVQLVTSFTSEDETIEVSFENVELQKEGDRKALAVKLFNSSQKMVKPIVRMEIYNKGGDLVMENISDKRKLYPDQCRTYYVALEDLELGDYQAVLVADCGNQDVFGLTVNLRVDE
jgi:hypothetical protein